MMRTFRFLLLLAAAVWPAAAQSWDTSGNSLLKGTYYFREVAYAVGDNYGDLQDAVALYNTVTFDGNGKYTMTGATVIDAAQGAYPPQNFSGAYSIAASGYGFLSNPLASGAVIYGLVSQAGIFVGSSTESGFNDLFMAVPVTSGVTVANLKGSYTFAAMDMTTSLYQGSVAYALGYMFQVNPDGAGNLGTFTMSGYFGGGGSTVYTQTATAIKYAAINNAYSFTIPNSNNAILTQGQKILYISSDGNFVFGGSANSFDFLVGVRTGVGSGTPNFSGLYYQAGIDEDASNLLSSGYALLDTYYGALSASGGVIVGHQRQSDVFFTNATGLTYADSYTLNSSGAYTDGDGVTKYVIGAGGAVRIGLGIGPYLGLSVALAAPAPSAPDSSPWIDPQGVLNAGSFAPFTAGVSAGELITIFGSNLAPNFQQASAIPFPNSLGGVQVTVNGLPAPLYYVSPTQIAAIVPYAVGTTIASIQVINNSAASNAVTELVNLTTPGVLTQTANGLGYGLIQHTADFSLVTKAHPAVAGETVAVYLTGLGAVNPAVADGSAGPTSTLSKATNTISADISGTTATVGFAGLTPGAAGLYQINLTIPTGLTAGDNTLDILGPDAYAAEALIPIASANASSAEAVGRRAGLRRRPAAEGAPKPALSRPAPCLSLGGCAPQ